MGPRVCKSPYFDATIEAGVTHFTIYNHMYMPGNQHPWSVSDGAGTVGTVRVVTYSPRLERNIAIALLDVGVEDQEHFRVQAPDGWRDATRTTLPFI